MYYHLLVFEKVTLVLVPFLQRIVVRKIFSMSFRIDYIMIHFSFIFHMTKLLTKQTFEKFVQNCSKETNVRTITCIFYDINCFIEDLDYSLYRSNVLYFNYIFKISEKIYGTYWITSNFNFYVIVNVIVGFLLYKVVFRKIFTSSRYNLFDTLNLL